jgi:predicted glycoside hydrolase/deacetylase ChbG (UPF0249 family)
MSAMVFMIDSERASELAKEQGIDVGLHLNFTERFSLNINNSKLRNSQEEIGRFLTKNKYLHIIYNPFLNNQFEYVFKMQLEEFQRLYGFEPSHIDGHEHMHLCSNMVWGGIIPKGQKIRKHFSYNKGEKNPFNRIYRKFIDNQLKKKYLTTDFLFNLPEALIFQKIDSVCELAKTFMVELETHPVNENELTWLNENVPLLPSLNIELGNYSQLISINSN